MISFYECQQRIKQYITDNYGRYLAEYTINLPEITTEFLDLDKFKNDFTLFIDINNMTFPVTQYSDDCEAIIKIQPKIFIVTRNDSPKRLQEKILNAAFAFYTMYRADNRFGISEDTIITSVDFYNYVEGTKYITAAEINMSMEISI